MSFSLAVQNNKQVFLVVIYTQKDCFAWLKMEYTITPQHNPAWKAFCLIRILSHAKSAADGAALFAVHTGSDLMPVSAHTFIRENFRG